MPRPPTPPGLLVNYSDHWAEKLRDYISLDIVVPSGVKCPNDATELMVLRDVKQGIVDDGKEIIIRRQFAICPNGHIFDL